MQVTSRKDSAPFSPRLRQTARIPRSRSPEDAATKRDQRLPCRQDLTTHPGQVKLPWPVATFLIGLITPWIIPVSTMSLSVYRIVLLAMLLPCLFMWVTGKAGKIRLADIFIVLFSLWISLSLAVVDGFEPMIQSIGINNIETLGAYLLARCYIRTANDFRNMVQFTCKLVILLLPFALYEWVTGAKPILTTFGYVFPTVEISIMDPRAGFWRVQGPFEHSILFGFFCGSLFALSYLVLGYGKGAMARWSKSAMVFLAALVSMSSAPIAGMVLQFALLLWNAFLRNFEFRWKILWGLVFVAYLVVSIGSNQTPAEFYISHFTFDMQTGWWRLHIWNYGSASVAAHPFFGIAFHDWVRPWWMYSGSVDNFWLVIAMRHGIPAFLLVLGACLAVIGGVALKKGDDKQVETFRIGYLLCIVNVMIVGCTVHFWGAAYVWFLFLLGSGVWIFDTTSDGDGSPKTPSFGPRRPGRGQPRSSERTRGNA